MTVFTSAIDRHISGVRSRLHLDDPLSGNRVLSRSLRRTLRRALCSGARNRRVTEQGRQNYQRRSKPILEENRFVVHFNLLIGTLSRTLGPARKITALLRKDLLRLSVGFLPRPRKSSPGVNEIFVERVSGA